jgi:outer membrane protein TolC
VSARRSPSWLLGSAAVVAGLAASAAADEEPAKVAGGLVLEQVVSATLAANLELKLAAVEVELAAGALTSSRAAFELTLTSSATASRLNRPDAMGATAVQNDLIFAAGAHRLLRNGVFATSEVSLTRSLLARSLGADTSTADVRLGVSIPILRDRGGTSSTADERAAARDHEAARLGMRHAAAQQVLAAVVAYWDYRAAHERLQVLRSSEARAERAVEETSALVKADERTPADLIQLRGNAASKRASRVAAEQAIAAARTELGLVMGLPADAIAALPLPATEFPEPGSPAGRLEAPRLVEETYQRRADLTAAEQRALAAGIRVEAARSEERPRLDLLLNTGYRNTTADDRRWYEPGLDALVELRLELPVSNSAARGQLAQRRATQVQRSLTREELRRRIAADVALGLEAVAHAEAAMRESAEAVSLFESGIQGVQRKFQLGSATLFDLIQAQDALTNALLVHVQSQRDHAIAIAVLRFQSGRLVEGERQALLVPVAELGRAP